MQFHLGVDRERHPNPCVALGTMNEEHSGARPQRRGDIQEPGSGDPAAGIGGVASGGYADRSVESPWIRARFGRSVVPWGHPTRDSERGCAHPRLLVEGPPSQMLDPATT
jgi:hypothetical protein